MLHGGPSTGPPVVAVTALELQSQGRMASCHPAER